MGQPTHHSAVAAINHMQGQIMDGGLQHTTTLAWQLVACQASGMWLHGGCICGCAGG
jgi:hypothetical protein